MECAGIAGARAPGFMEHRWGQRVTLDLPVHVQAESRARAGQLRDDSISGGFIETDLALPLFANLTVCVLLGEGAARRAVALPGCVTRIDDAGVGVEWRDMACPSLLTLLRGTGADFAHLT